MIVRPARPSDEDAWVTMRVALWPDGSADEHRTEVRQFFAGRPPTTLPSAVFMAELDGEVVGFTEVGLRSHADGCDPIRPVGFLEGWYVAPHATRQGIGRALVERAEAWAKENGATEFASDTWADNPTSEAAHLALGFEVVDRCINFRKSLSSPGATATDDKAHYAPDLARIHHAYFGMVAEGAASELIRQLEARNLMSGTVFELGCGSGIMSRAIVDAGFDLRGIDISEGMLTIARAHAPKGHFERASLWDVELTKSVAITGIGEVFNYVTSAATGDLARLEARFADIKRALVPGGVFLFDTAGPGRSGPTGIRHTSWEKDGAFIFLEEAETKDPPSLVRHIRTFWPVGALHRSTVETHRQVLYPADAVHAALERVGFEVERLKGYDTFTFKPGWTGFIATVPRL